jgi:hypothetical protein
MISLQTSYRFDNCHCAGRAKDGDEQQVALHRRKTTTKRRHAESVMSSRTRGSLQDSFHFALILEAPRPAAGSSGSGFGRAILNKWSANLSHAM